MTSPSPRPSEDALTQVLGIVEQLTKISQGDVRYGLNKLHAWRTLALAGVDFTDGDRVVITDAFKPISQSSGWYTYRECLRPGQTGIASRIDIRPVDLMVFADFVPETEWSVATWQHGPKYYPSRHPHRFMLRVDELRRATDADVALPLPPELTEVKTDA